MEVLGLKLKKVGDNYWTFSGRPGAVVGDVDIQLTDSRAQLLGGMLDLYLSVYDQAAPGCEAMARKLEERYADVMLEKSGRSNLIAKAATKLRNEQRMEVLRMPPQAKVGASATFMAARPSHPSTENPPERSVLNAAKVDAALLGSAPPQHLTCGPLRLERDEIETGFYEWWSGDALGVHSTTQPDVAEVLAAAIEASTDPAVVRFREEHWKETRGNHDAAYDAARHPPKPSDKGEVVGQQDVTGELTVKALRSELRRRTTSLNAATKQAKRWKEMALRYREEAHGLSRVLAATRSVKQRRDKLLLDARKELEERDESITDLVNKVEALENRNRQQGITIERYQEFKDAILDGVKRKKVEKLLGRELAERMYSTHAPTVEAELKADEPIPYAVQPIAALETKCWEYGKKIKAQEARLAERGQTIRRLEDAKHNQLSIIRDLERDKQQLNREIADLKNSTRDTLKTERDLRREIEVLRAETEAAKKAFATAPGADMSSYEARCNLAEALGRVKGLELRLRDDPYDRPTLRLKKMLINSQEHRRKLLKQRRALRREVTALQRALARRFAVAVPLDMRSASSTDPYATRQGIKWRNIVLVKTSRLLHAASFGLVKFEAEQDGNGAEGFRGWVWLGNRYWYSRGPSHQEALEAACAKAKPELGDTLHGLQVILR